MRRRLFAIAMLAGTGTVVGLYFPASALWKKQQESHRAANRNADAIEQSFYSDLHVEETMRRGDEILDALHAYRAANGRWPGQLDGLCPQFLVEIPLPTAGERCWKYVVLPSGDVELVFGLGAAGDDYYPCYYKGSMHDEWHIDS